MAWHLQLTFALVSWVYPRNKVKTGKSFIIANFLGCQGILHMYSIKQFWSVPTVKALKKTTTKNCTAFRSHLDFTSLPSYSRDLRVYISYGHTIPSISNTQHSDIQFIFKASMWQTLETGKNIHLLPGWKMFSAGVRTTSRISPPPPPTPNQRVHLRHHKRNIQVRSYWVFMKPCLSSPTLWCVSASSIQWRGVERKREGRQTQGSGHRWLWERVRGRAKPREGGFRGREGCRWRRKELQKDQGSSETGEGWVLPPKVRDAMSEPQSRERRMWPPVRSDPGVLWAF